MSQNKPVPKQPVTKVMDLPAPNKEVRDNMILVNLPLSRSQVSSLSKAMVSDSPTAIKLSKDDLQSGYHPGMVQLFITNRNFKRLKKNVQDHKGVVLNLSKNEVSQNRKAYKAMSRDIDKQLGREELEPGMDEMEGGIAASTAMLLAPFLGGVANKIFGSGMNNDPVFECEGFSGKGLFLPHKGGCVNKSNNASKKSVSKDTNKSQKTKNTEDDIFLDEEVVVTKNKSKSNVHTYPPKKGAGLTLPGSGLSLDKVLEENGLMIVKKK